LNKTKIPGHAHFQNHPGINSNYPLIGPGDEPPFVSYNDNGKAPVLLVADHASPFFPAGLKQLGLDDSVLEQHVAWDIGSDMLARFLADELDAQLVLAGFSRLIVDPNRKLNSPTAFPELSDGIAIPGNIGLDETQKALRVQSFFKPYHDAITDKLNAFKERGIVPAMISIHTCTPVLDRIVRPWHIGILWDTDPRLPKPFIDYFNQVGEICIGDNKPYSGRHPNDFTIDHHAEPAGLPHMGIEVRQDLVSDAEGARKWAGILATGLEDILADESLYCVLSLCP